MKLNKTRQQMYLDGKVGLINDGTVEQLREVTDDRDYMGSFTYYHKNRIFPSEAPLDNVQYHPIAWFYENEMELPKNVRVDKATGGKEWYADFIGKIFDVTGECDSNHYTVLHLGSKKNYLIDKSDCTPINETNNELPKKIRVDKANDGWYDTEIGNVFNVISEDDGKYFVEHPLNTEYLKHFIHKSDCTPINETNNELPKVGEWWECVEDVSIDGSKIFTSGKKYKCEDEGYLTNNNKKRTLIVGCIDYRSHFIKCTQPTPSSYKLKIDIPEWVLKAGDEIEVGRLPRSIMEYIATPIYTQPFTLENGTEIELTNNDIDKIKKL